MCKTSQESAVWTSGFQTSVSKTLNSWWNDSKAYVKDMSPPYTMSLSGHWLLSGCHHPSVTDAGGMDGCKHNATLERQVIYPEGETFQVYPGSVVYP